MYVKDHMTKNPYTITPDVTVSKAVDIMAKNDFHRLPIVDETGHLLGLITGGLVEEGSGARSTSLSIYELNYLLSKTTVKDMMIKDVMTITEDVFVEEAAQKMIDNDIAVLPVVDGENKVIGIITDRDIFQAFTELLGYKQQGTRFVIACEDHPGFFRGVANCFAEHDANLESIAVYRTKERGTEVVVKATGDISTEDMIVILKESGYQVKDALQTTKYGTLKRVPV